MKTSLSTMLKRIKHRNWRVTRYGEIRCKTGGCPLTIAGYVINPKIFKLLGGTIKNVNSYRQGARAIGFTGDPATFTLAADSTEYTLMGDYGNLGDTGKAARLIKMRRQILKDLGLKENKGKTLADWKKEQ